MGVVRNCIDIIGITPENQLPKKINGQLIEVSEVENIVIDSGIKMKNIYQVIIDTDIKGTRVINAPLNRIIVIDGYKRFKIAYYDENNNMGILEVKKPYNLFYDIESPEVDIEKTNIYIADAYFELIDNVVYCHIIYIVDIHYFGDVTRLEPNNSTIKFMEIEDKQEIKQDEGEKENIKYDFFQEVSLSQDNKIELDIDKEIDSMKEITTIDIDYEYL